MNVSGKKIRVSGDFETVAGRGAGRNEKDVYRYGGVVV